MTLPSQHGRTASRRSYMYQRRRSHRGRLAAIVFFFIVICVAAWYFIFFRTGSSDEAENQSDQIQDSLAVNSPAPSSIQPQQPVERPQRPVSSPNQVNEATDRSSESQTPPVVQNRPAVTPEPQVQQPQVRPSQPTAPPREAVDPQLRSRALELMRSGVEFLSINKPIEGRQYLTRALDSGALNSAEEQHVREQLTALNAQLVFSPEVIPGDPFAQQYTIASGDVLSQVPRKQGLNIDWRFLQSINNIPDPRRIRAGQRIKLVTGPFHAVVHKRDFRLDLYLGEIGNWVYVCSFPVGLGEYNSTPTGVFQVRLHSKLVNPEWVNPRTGKRFLPDDQDNPIGERWIGLQGVSDAIRDLRGYGLHGTIEPESIGRESSLGCIRLSADDVELIYEMLVEERSTVEIRGD